MIYWNKGFSACFALQVLQLELGCFTDILHSNAMDCYKSIMPFTQTFRFEVRLSTDCYFDSYHSRTYAPVLNTRLTATEVSRNFANCKIQHWARRLANCRILHWARKGYVSTPRFRTSDVPKFPYQNLICTFSMFPTQVIALNIGI